MQIYEVTWTVIGSVQVQAIGPEDAKNKVDSMTLAEIIEISESLIGPDATDCQEAE